MVFENDVIAVVDGQFGFGQVMGEQAMKLGVAKAGRQGVAVVALRNSGHLGRIGACEILRHPLFLAGRTGVLTGRTVWMSSRDVQQMSVAERTGHYILCCQRTRKSLDPVHGSPTNFPETYRM